MDYRIFEKHHRQLRINCILWSLDLCEKKNIILVLSNVTYTGVQVDNFNPIACCSLGFNDKPQDKSLSVSLIVHGIIKIHFGINIDLL